METDLIIFFKHDKDFDDHNTNYKWYDMLNISKVI